jgi:hypothetical protein
MMKAKRRFFGTIRTRLKSLARSQIETQLLLCSLPASSLHRLMYQESACTAYTIKFGNMEARDHCYEIDGDGVRKGSLRKQV